MKAQPIRKIIRIFLFLTLLGLSAYSYSKNRPNITLSTSKVVAASCTHTECAQGETSVGSCGATGCGANQRIYCPCQPPGTVGLYWCFGGCYCVDDATCGGGGGCIDGQTGGCGTNGCSSGQTSLCVSGSWTCSASGSCGYIPGCSYNPSSPPGCTTEGTNTPYPPGTCSGGSNNGAGCVYDTACPGGTCSIPNQNRCCDGLVWNYPTNGICVCPTCNATNPTPISLVSPANNSVNLENTVILDWSNVASWGTGCPQANNYSLKYAVKAGANCPAIGSASYTSVSTGTTSTRTLSNLPWGNTYCWYVQATNGSSAVNSLIWQFSIAKTPTLVSSGIVSAMSCGASISGNASVNGTDNPITFYSEYSLNDNGVGIGGINEVTLAIVPNDYVTASPVSEAVLMDTAKDYFMAIADIDPNNPNQSTFRIVNKNGTAGEYSNSLSSGNLTNSAGAATLMNINDSGNANSTHVQIIDANTLRIYWQVKFEDQYKYTNTGSLYTSIINNNIYTAAFREYSSGLWNSSSGSRTIDRSLSNIMPWGVNVQIPKVQIGAPVIINATDFSIAWNATAYNLVAAEGYMWTKNQPISIDKVSPTPTGTFTLPVTEPNTDTLPVPNSNVNVYYRTGLASKLGTHRYSLNATGNLTDLINTKMYVRDTACNYIVDSGSALNLTGRWLMTASGSVYAPDFKFTVQQANIASNATVNNGGSGGTTTTGDDFSYLNPFSYLSTYLSSALQKPISASSRQSKRNFLLESYNDWNGLVPKTSSSTNWYDYLLKVVSKNATVTPVATNTILTATKTKAILTSINSTYTGYVEFTGNLTIQKNVVCNTHSIFFVRGNLNIIPDFTTASPNSTTNGCMFIVKGNITIQNGDFNNYYDKINGFFITNGSFNTLIDKNSTTDQYDGLYIYGGIIAQNTDFERTFQLLKNLSYPAEIIEYDARYAILFANDLKTQDYSIREKDFLKKVNK